MATNGEMQAFENFKFNVGDIVRPIIERKSSEVIAEEAKRNNAEAMTAPLIGMVTSRWLGQDESGVSRVYKVKFVDLGLMLKEFEIEQV